jgi:hypothetical protein
MPNENLNKEKSEINDCFIIMPVSDPDGYDKGHFKKVYEDIFKVACEKSGFHAIRSDEVLQTNLIHLDILQKLIASPMAICDLSNRNPNVLFELGLRQAFDKPTVLVQECGTPKIFDIAPLRYTEYRKELHYREVLEDQITISEALKATKKATDSGEGINSIINLLSLSSPASLKDVTVNDSAKMLQIVMSEMNELRTDFQRTIQRIDERDINDREIQNRYDIDLERSIKDFRLLNELAVRGASFERIKELYDRIQTRLLRLLKRQLPSEIHQQAKNMLIEADIIVSKCASRKE